MYRVAFDKEAEADLARIDKPNAQRIVKRIRWLAENFDNLSPELLTGPWKGMCKLRVGDYRVIYTVSSKQPHTIIIHLIGHRRDIYKRK